MTWKEDFLEVDSMMINWWIVAFLCGVCSLLYLTLSNVSVLYTAICPFAMPAMT